MMKLFAMILLAWSVAVPASGQEPPTQRQFVLRGTVFDSIAGAPLAGARVEVAARGSASAPHSAVTDASGRFEVAALPSGVFVVGFYHDNLTALGLEAPLTTVELGLDSVVTVHLGIPSAAVVRVLRCGGESVVDVGGMLVGYVRDAASRLAVPGAVLRLSWGAFALDSGDYRTVVERATAVVTPDGSFLACHLPLDATLELELTAPGHRPLSGSVVVIPADGLARLDLDLVDTTRVIGASQIRGEVSRPNGKAVPTGRATIAALGRDVPIRDGEFLMTDIPPGSWVVDVRAMGSEPQSTLISATDSAVNRVALRIGESLQRLEAVTVVGKRDANTRLLEEVLRRKRIGMGTVFLPGSPALRSAIWTSDVMKEARGFLYRGPTDIVARAKCRFIAVYVDDILQPNGFGGLEAVAPPGEVLAIETFPDILLAPVQYRIMKYVLGTTNRYCAVVLVWTKNRARD
ncbi:MAG: carboxypeptidase-like regulatory domain-containing protein [Gemmatimonadaceae bacterium]